MSTFETPEPITARVKLGAGDVAIDATASTQTEVSVRPSNPSSSRDVAHAEATTVEYAHGLLIVEAPETHGGASPSINVRIRLPEHSSLELKSGSADLTTNGWLGNVEALTGSGDIRVGDLTSLTSKTGSGDVRAGRVESSAEISTGSGDITIQHIAGDGWLSTASGNCSVETADGVLEINTASGDIRVGRASQGVETKSASGDTTVHTATSGVVSFNCASGDVSIGVPNGTAALLDVTSLTGDVRSALEQTNQPAETDNRLEIRGRTLTGDITVTRSR